MNALMLTLRFTNLLKFLSVASMWLFATATWAEHVDYDGLIEPYDVIEIGSPVEGIVANVTVDRSSPVMKGQLLVSLESSVERAAVEKAKAMAALNGEIKMQQTQLAFAKRVHKRVKKLGAISTHDKDQAATDINLTWQRLVKAKENRDLAKIELKKTQALLARREIKSPISGVVVDRYVSPGEYVNHQPLLRVARIDPLRVEVIVPAEMFGKIVPGMSAIIHPELPEYGQQTATVAIVDRVIDSASSTFGVRLDLPNPGLRIPSGLKCLVRFEMDPAKDHVDQSTTLKNPEQARK